MQPKVSIIIPAYNVKNYIAECLRSVISQTFSAWEAIVIDDGSVDATAEIVKEFADERIYLIQQENAGLSASRNKGVSLAKADYVLFLDSDDRLHSETLQKCYDLVQEYHLDAITFDGYDFVVKNGKEQRFEDCYFNRSKKLTEGIYLAQELLRKEVFGKAVVVSAPLYMVKKEQLKKVPFVEGLLHEDVLFHYSLLPQLESIYYLPCQYYQRRLRAGSIIHSTPSLKSLTSYQYIIKELEQKYFQAPLKDRRLYRKIIAKNMLQVGKLSKRYLLAKNTNKKTGLNVLKSTITSQSLSLLLCKLLYFKLGAVYYLFADWKAKNREI